MSTQYRTNVSTQRSLNTAGLPRRVRKVLELALELVSDSLNVGLVQMLDGFEDELLHLAGQARAPGSEANYMQALRSIQQHRTELGPLFMRTLEASLADIRTPPPESADPAIPAELPGFTRLSLIDESVMDEDTVLREIASRQEGRANFALHLLGQRFGVLAGAPAFDAEHLPLGPQALCEAMRTASQSLQLEQYVRQLLYRYFDRHVMSSYASALEALDRLLDGQGILPGLTHVPTRLRPASAPPPEPRPATQGKAQTDDASIPAREPGDKPPSATRPHTSWLGEPPEMAVEDEQAAVDRLTSLLAERHKLLDKLTSPVPPKRATEAAQPQLLRTEDLFSALGNLQVQSAGSPSGEAPSLSDIRKMLLAQARQQGGPQMSLSRKDSDTFDLLGMLYTHLEEEIRKDAPAAALVRRLQIPLLRMALLDRTFFVRSHHPARQFLGNVAENAAKWLDDADFDPQLLLPLQSAVNEVITRFDGDIGVFASANERLQSHLQAKARKAEMLERRHAEAARGKEKLEVAKLRAGETLGDLLGDQTLPRFTMTLLNQAWLDALTLTLLRQGEDSDAWRHQLDATRQIVACNREEQPPAPELLTHIEDSLGQVGYHADEAAQIAQRLTGSLHEDDDAPGSRTELVMKIKARTRLGEDSKVERAKLPPRTPAEEACYEQLKITPFGTWIEFVVNQQGDVVRKRLSWYSRITDNALFVNQRGQRIGEQSLDHVARLIAAGQARIVTVERARLVDRAWQAAINALRSFAGLGGDSNAGAHGEGR